MVVGGGFDNFGVHGAGIALLTHPSDPAVGSLRTKLRSVVRLEHGFCRGTAGRHCLVGCALARATAARKIWQSTAGEVGQYFCLGGYFAGHIDLCGVLPVCYPLHRGVV